MGTYLKENNNLGLWICCCSITQSCPTLCNPMNSNTSDFLILHHLLELAQTHVHWVNDASKHLVLCDPLLLPFQSFPASGCFPSCRLFASGGQSVGASASAAVLPMNIQDLFLLELTGLISLPSKRLSRVFSNTTVQNRPSTAKNK